MAIRNADLFDLLNRQGVVWTADKLSAYIPVEWHLGTPEKLILQAQEVYGARVNHGIGQDQTTPLVLAFTPASYALVEDMAATQMLRADGEKRGIHVVIVGYQPEGGAR